jgi:hypothetical protein
MIETIISVEDQQILDSMKKAVSNALEYKRRLGQYAVIWEDGRPVTIGGKELMMESILSPSTETPKQSAP